MVALFLQNDALAEKMKMIANHGQSRQYYHDVVGCNSRLDTIQAAILDIKLKHLDEYIAARRAAANFYDKAFAGHPKITTPFRAPYSDHAFHQYTLLLEDESNSAALRNGLKDFLQEYKIPCMIYYPVPGHRQKMFGHFNTTAQSMQVTDWLTDRVASLPMHTELDEEQQNFIADKIFQYLSRYKSSSKN